jgi:hypothetical protein
MTVVSCPLCGFKVNALTLHCPECGADPGLPPGQAQLELRARGLPLPGPRVKRAWTLRRRLVVITVAVLATLVVLAPLWSGYFGPRAAAYVTTWRPWRSHLTLRSERTFPHKWPQHATMEAEYRDPWPGYARTPGWEHDFLTLKRLGPWLPWVVTERGSGP